MKSIEITANSVESAVEEACQQLGVGQENVTYEVVKEGGFIRKKYTVLVTKNLTALEVAKNFVVGVIEKMGLNCSVEAIEDDKNITLSLTGDDTSALIGYRGDVLDGLQYLTLLVTNKFNPQSKRVVIDGENYREKRAITLTKLAKRLAFKASKNNEIIKLEPMNPFERRIIHSALHDDTYVTTESEGDEPNRYIVIKPVRKERTRNNYDRNDRNNNRNDRNRNSRPRKEYSQNAYNNTTTDNASTNYTNNNEIETTENVDMYDEEYSRNFKKTGVTKMKSFGTPKRKF